MSNLKKLIILLILLLIGIPLIGFGAIYFKLNSMYVPDKNTKKNEFYENAKKNKDITNILLAGVDGTNIEKGNRSDSMMILTIDNKHGKLKLTSLARDTYVDISGYSTEKLTHAYAYEGPNLLLETIEKNFGINIDKYITVSFNSFIDIVDILGGIDVEVKENDLNMLNKYIKTSYKFDAKENKEPVKLIETAGTHKLNGYQALAFSRIRYQDSAYARDSRQREVIQSIVKDIEKQGIDKFIKILNTGIKNVKTNLSPVEMISLGYRAMTIKDKNIEELEFPVYKEGKILPGKGWVIQWDKEKNLEILNNFIFNNGSSEKYNR